MDVENGKECPFCDRVQDRKFVGRDYVTDVVWFEPLNPVTPGHMLFVPWHHVEHLDMNAPRHVGEAFRAASRYAQRQALWSYNLITSYGSDATQTIDHVHVHLVPRRPDDGLQLPWGLPRG